MTLPQSPGLLDASLAWNALDVFFCLYISFAYALRPKSHLLQKAFSDYCILYESLPPLLSLHPKGPHLLYLALC